MQDSALWKGENYIYKSILRVSSTLFSVGLETNKKDFMGAVISYTWVLQSHLLFYGQHGFSQLSDSMQTQTEPMFKLNINSVSQTTLSGANG